MKLKAKGIKGLKSIRDSFKTRQFKYGGYAALITLAVFVGLLLMNLILEQFSPQIDMTESGHFTLTEQTLQVVDQVQSPVLFYGLWRTGMENQQLLEVIDLYLARNRNIRLEVVDPNRNPGLVSRFDRGNEGISEGSLVVEGERGFRVITPMDMYDFSFNQRGGSTLMGVSMERRITAALLFAATGRTPVIYEIVGRQESLLDQFGIQPIVERENFDVRQLNLIQSDIPEDASILIINTPRSDITQGEADKILDFLELGGRLMILADFRSGELPILNQIMASYGMQFDFGYLIENNFAYTAGAFYLAIPDLEDHDITNPVAQERIPVLLPYSMGISETPARRRTVELMPLLTSSNDAYLRTNIDEFDTDRIDSDLPGPIIMGMTAIDPSWIQGDEPQARIVAIACGGLLEPVSFFGQIPGNIDLFMNSIAWLEDRPETLTVRSKSMFLLPMRINEFQMIFYGVIIVIIIPLGFFISGFVIWLRRRHL